LLFIVDMTTGKPCVAFLDDPEVWEPGTTITGILQSLQVLLEEILLNGIGFQKIIMKE